MTKTNFGLTVKNKALLGCGDFHHTYTFDNTGKRKSAFTAYLKANVSKTAHISTINLSHHLTGQVIVKNDVKVQPQTEDMTKEVTCFDIGIYRNQTLAFLNTLLRKYRNAFTPVGDKPNKLKDQKVIAKDRLNNYPSRALSKISRLALVGYEYTSVYSPLRAFFMRNISMRSHRYGEAGEGHFRVCWFLVFQSTNPFQLCHPHLVVNGKAPNTHGVHTHAY